jgi:hypothetical protein
MNENSLRKVAEDLEQSLQHSQQWQDFVLQLQELLLAVRDGNPDRRHDAVKRLERAVMGLGVPVPSPKSPAHSGPGAGSGKAHSFSCPQCGAVLNVS